MPNLFRAMPPTVRTSYEEELRRARSVPSTEAVWTALERAHILSQPWPWPHTRSHWHMLRIAVCCRDRTEAVGQLIRIIAAGPASATARAPEGNTGRTRVGIRTPMPLPDDLARILATAGYGPKAATKRA